MIESEYRGTYVAIDLQDRQRGFAPSIWRKFGLRFSTLVQSELRSPRSVAFNTWTFDNDQVYVETIVGMIDMRRMPSERAFGCYGADASHFTCALALLARLHLPRTMLVSPCLEWEGPTWKAARALYAQAFGRVIWKSPIAFNLGGTCAL